MTGWRTVLVMGGVAALELFSKTVLGDPFIQGILGDWALPLLGVVGVALRWITTTAIGTSEPE